MLVPPSTRQLPTEPRPLTRTYLRLLDAEADLALRPVSQNKIGAESISA
jgi:hypothetical protein